MDTIGLLDRFRNRSPGSLRLDMVTDQGNGFYAWDGRLYKSDIVRAAIRPKAKAVGKLMPKHLREQIDRNGKKKLTVNPDAHIRFLLEEPNPYMSGQKFREKMETQLCLNNNAFALIIRNDEGFPLELFPLPARQVDALYDQAGNLKLRFYFPGGKAYVFPYTDIIHLRNDLNENDLFGEPLGPALKPLMDVVTTTDQGIINAIKNSGVVRWLLKYFNAMRQEDLEENAKKFADNYLNVESKSIGVAATDSKAEVVQIQPHDYVPNAAQMDRTTQRIYSLLGTNEKIIQSSFDEDGWNSYYEAEIEPDVIDMEQEYTRKLFTRRERGLGNRIVFEASPLTAASMKSKLDLIQLVDRAIITPNEYRAVFNYAPVPWGDQPIRRLDTAPVGDDGITIREDEKGGEDD